MRPLLLASMLAALLAHAEDMPPEKRAALAHDQQKASDAVDKKYGNKKPSELSADERKSMMKEKAGAQREVLEKAGVDPKEFARSGSKLGREEKASTDAAGKALDAKDAAAAKEAGAPKAAGKKEIVIEKNGKTADPEVNEAAEMDKKLNQPKQKSKGKK